MLVLSSTDRSYGRLLRGSDGAVGLLFAVCASLMIGTMCAALDAIDYVTTRGRVQMALDAATLAAGVDLTRFGAAPTGNDLLTWQADALSYYQANMVPSVMDFLMPDSNFSAKVSGTPTAGQTITLSTFGVLSFLSPPILSLMATGGGPSTPGSAIVSANNTATRVLPSTLELVMVLDNTGSMSDSAGNGGMSKLQAVKNAANALVTDLLTSVDASQNYIGLVPFASTVNVGAALSPSGSWLSQTLPPYNPNGIIPSQWGGCTAEPRSPSGTLLPAAYSPSDSSKFTQFYYNVPPAGLQSRTYSGSCSSKPTMAVIASTVPISKKTVKGTLNYCGYNPAGSGIGAFFDNAGSSSTTLNLNQNSDCITTPVTFLTQSVSTLSAKINGMTAAGSTAIPIGLLWGWRMLEPSWSQDIAGANNGWISTDRSLPKPIDGSVQNLQRVMIVLTDGENVIGAPGSIPNDLYFNGLSGIGTNDLAPYGITDQPTNIDNFQRDVCTAIKTEGIAIYTIALGSLSTNAKNNLQSCATNPSMFYSAPDSSNLTTIFEQIAGRLGVFRITQ